MSSYLDSLRKAAHSKVEKSPAPAPVYPPYVPPPVVVPADPTVEFKWKIFAMTWSTIFVAALVGRE